MKLSSKGLGADNFISQQFLRLRGVFFLFSVELKTKSFKCSHREGDAVKCPSSNENLSYSVHENVCKRKQECLSANLS